MFLHPVFSPSVTFMQSSWSRVGQIVIESLKMRCILNSFLGCCKLRTGCLILGYFGSIFNFFGMISMITFLILIGMRLIDIGDQKIDDFTMNFVMGLGGGVIVFCSIWFALNVTLLVAIYQERPKLLKVFVISVKVYMVFLVGLFLIAYVGFFGLVAVLTIACSSYYVVVVKSYYLELKEVKLEPFEKESF